MASFILFNVNKFFSILQILENLIIKQYYFFKFIIILQFLNSKVIISLENNSLIDFSLIN